MLPRLRALEPLSYAFLRNATWWCTAAFASVLRLLPRSWLSSLDGLVGITWHARPVAERPIVPNFQQGVQRRRNEPEREPEPTASSLDAFWARSLGHKRGSPGTPVKRTPTSQGKCGTSARELRHPSARTDRERLLRGLDASGTRQRVAGSALRPAEPRRGAHALTPVPDPSPAGTRATTRPVLPARGRWPRPDIGYHVVGGPEARGGRRATGGGRRRLLGRDARRLLSSSAQQGWRAGAVPSGKRRAPAFQGTPPVVLSWQSRSRPSSPR